MRLILFYSLLFSNLCFSMDFRSLDQMQEKLYQNYQQTITGSGTSAEVMTLIQKTETQKSRTALKQIEQYLKSYDAFTLTKIDLFMQTSLKELRTYYSDLRPNLRRRHQRKSDKHLQEIEEHFRIYGENRGNMGQQNDSIRTLSGRKFFQGIGKFVNKLRELQGEKVTRVWGAPPFTQIVKEMAPVAEEMLGALYATYFKARRNGVNEAPIIDSLREVAKSMAEEKKTKTQWRGLEHFEPMPLDGETLNLLVFMHANSYFDTSVQGTLELPGLSSIGNVDLVFPGFIAKRFDKSDHVVAVGRSDMIKKTVDIVRSKRLNKFFIAAEGLTPVGFYEMRPLIDIFATSVYELMRKGLKVNIYPVSFPDNFRLMNEFRNPIEGDKLAYGIVHKPIKMKEIQEIYRATGDEQALSNYIRWVWFGDLINNHERDLSMPKPTQMKEWLDGMVWGNL